MRENLIPDFAARKRALGGNPQINVRFTAEWQARLDELAREGEGGATLIKDWLYPLLSGSVTCERNDAGRVIAITGHDANGKKVTIRCDGKPAVKLSQPLPDAPQRGRPRKSPEGG